MRALGHYILRGPIHAIALTSFISIATLLIPAMAYLLSGMPIGLVTLRKGGIKGGQIIIGSLFLTLLLTFAVQIIPMVAYTYAIGVWLPVWCCAMVLRNTQSQGMLVLAAGLIGGLYVIISHLVFEDVTVWWKSWFDLWLERNFSTVTFGEREMQLLETIVPLMNAMVAAIVVVCLIVTSLGARWWQSLLFNEGGFRKEFYSLRLPRGLCYITLISIVVLWFIGEQQQSVLRDLLIVVVFLYLFQGLSAIHRIVFVRKMPNAWLVVMYCLLFVLPQMLLFIACIGMAESWFSGLRPTGGDDSSGTS